MAGLPVDADRRLSDRVTRYFSIGKSKRRHPVSACLLGLLTCTMIFDSARALEFKCVEPSRYKHLLQAFNDNPSTLTSYFGLERTQLPDMNTCRALAVTGTIRAGDAHTLLDQVIQSKGWLAVLYLAFDGVHIDEEIKLARIIRTSWLKTRFVRSPPLRYEPDFASQWGKRAVESADEPSAASSSELSFLNRALQAFARRGDLDLPIPWARNVCLESCIGAWGAGVHRRATPPPPATRKPYPGGSIPEMVTARVRAALVTSLDTGKVAQSTEPMLNKPVAIGDLSVTPPAVERLLREKCAGELIAGEALEKRVGTAMDDLARNNYRALHDSPVAILTQYDSLRMAGVRLQRCVAASYEKERLANFGRLCPRGCDKTALRHRLDQNARQFVENNVSFANIVGLVEPGDIGRQWQQEEAGWDGVWTRRGTSGVFDAAWVGPNGQQSTGTVEIGRAGDRVMIVRTQEAGRCLYQGTVSGRMVRGTYSCFWTPGAFAWEARISD